MADAPRSELQELVNPLNETLEMEYKSWLNLSNNASRADLARHIAALANYGGARILFDIAADMTYVARIQMLSPASIGRKRWQRVRDECSWARQLVL